MLYEDKLEIHQEFVERLDPTTGRMGVFSEVSRRDGPVKYAVGDQLFGFSERLDSDPEDFQTFFEKYPDAVVMTPRGIKTGDTERETAIRGADIPLDELRAKVSAEESVDTLIRWLQLDNRKTAQALYQARIRRLLKAGGADGGGDSPADPPAAPAEAPAGEDTDLQLDD